MHDEKTAQKALEAVQDGTELDKVYEEYSSDSASYSNEEVLITTQSTDLPTRLINTMYKQKMLVLPMKFSHLRAVVERQQLM